MQPDLIWRYLIVSWSGLCKNEIVGFKAKVTVKVQNLIDSLCIWYPLYHWCIGNQTRCADLLLLITEPSTTKWAITDSSTLTHSITTGPRWRWGYFAAQGDKLFFFFFCTQEILPEHSGRDLERGHVRRRKLSTWEDESDQPWNCCKGNIYKNSDRLNRVDKMGFFERVGTTDRLLLNCADCEFHQLRRSGFDTSIAQIRSLAWTHFKVLLSLAVPHALTCPSRVDRRKWAMLKFQIVKSRWERERERERERESIFLLRIIFFYE